MRSTRPAAVAKACVAALMGVFVLGLAAPAAAGDRRPPICKRDHDHRSHNARYYDYYPADRYYRAGPYRGSGVSVTIRSGDRYDRRYDRRGRYDDRRRYDRYDRYDRYGDRRRRGRRGREVVFREVLPTRGRARIVVVEEIIYRYDNRRRVCTVSVRGPDADYVPYRRLRRVARNYCSRRASIRIRG